MGEHAAEYKRWKENVPVLYDWFTNHNLTWPSLSCRWGCNREEQKYRRKQLVYLSERTDGSDPNKLIVVVADITNPRVAAAETITNFKEKSSSPFIQPHCTIFHPGEVNKIRELPQHPHIVITHSDAKELFVWNIEQQKNRVGDKKGQGAKRASVPDLILTGHREIAEFALATCSVAPLVASGGKDTDVLIWDLRDYNEGSLLDRSKKPSQSETAPTLAAKIVLKGHTDTVEDIGFKPGSEHELASVGDDKSVRLWDTRTGTTPTTSLEQAHGDNDVHCVDWSAFDPFLLATGAADGSLKVWDPRKLGSPSDALFSFEFHKEPIMRVEWAPYKPGVLASGGEDRMICVWDLNRPPDERPQFSNKKGLKKQLPQQLMFQHSGHRAGVADFQWHQKDPYTMISVSAGEGGTMQIWRINSLIYEDPEEVMKDLEPYRDYILKGKGKPPKPPARSPDKQPTAGGTSSTPLSPPTAPTAPSTAAQAGPPPDAKPAAPAPPTAPTGDVDMTAAAPATQTAPSGDAPGAPAVTGDVEMVPAAGEEKPNGALPPDPGAQPPANATPMDVDA